MWCDICQIVVVELKLIIVFVSSVLVCDKKPQMDDTHNKKVCACYALYATSILAFHHFIICSFFFFR